MGLAQTVADPDHVQVKTHTNRAFLAVLLLGCWIFGSVGSIRGSEVLSSEEGYAAVRDLSSAETKVRKRAAKRLTAAGDETLVPALVDSIFFTPREKRRPLYQVLTALTGEKLDGYYAWVEYVGSREDLVPKEGYLGWKATQLSRIDRRYQAVFYKGAPSKIRLQEIVSGGVSLEGIPAVDAPVLLSAEEARYLKDSEKVFGVELDGQSRAYPVRILSWHEMLNDQIGERPVTLSYCTLCGSGILYDTRTATGGRYNFGTSGLLYRSNKLMIDRETLSLWSNLTGKPVVGRLAQSGLELPVLPMTLTTWGEWRKSHPQTQTLDLDGLRKKFSRQFGFDYRPGAADRARSGVSFPVWKQSSQLDRETEIYALIVDGQPKAYPIDTVLAERVINDRLGERNIVVIGSGESGAVRVFERGDRSFQADTDGAVVDESGKRWKLGEQALSSTAGDESLTRLPGHAAFWFGWYAFYPETALYAGTSSGKSK